MPTFSGRSVDGLSILRYLYKEHPEQCMFVLESALNKEVDLDPWHKVAFVWMDQYLSVPGGSISDMKFETERCSHNLIVVPLIMVDDKRLYLHANFLVIDKGEEVAEIFEPYGSMPPIYGLQEPLDAALRKCLKKLFSSKNAKLERPLLASGKGLQALQQLEGLMRTGPGLPPGYCMAWCAMYAKLRLASPMELRNLVPEKLLAMAIDKQTHPSMTEFIRKNAEIFVA
jgi:hypothetical protein